MKLVALVQKPADPDTAARAFAAAAGLTAAEARMRLAPEPPAVLARLEPAAADVLVAALRQAGLAALAVELPVPTDDARTVARTFVVDAAGVSFTPRRGEALQLGWADVAAVLRAVRGKRAEVETTEKTRKLSPGAAVLTGGLALTRTTTKTVRSSEEAIEQVLLVIARDGRVAVVAEGRVDFSCLGARMSPSSTANLQELARQLRERAQGGLHDDRLVRLGRRQLPFVAATDWRLEGGGSRTTLTDTSANLDVLVEIMRQGLALGLVR